MVEPLPHQISAVYVSLLHMQPFRFLLAEDQGAEKTMMAGFLIKELITRGNLQGYLVVCQVVLRSSGRTNCTEDFSYRSRF